METYRQGDILFIRTEEIPKDAKKFEHRIVAEGETTGHAHQFLDEHVSLWGCGITVGSPPIFSELYVDVPDMTDREFEQLVDKSMKKAAPKGAVLSHEEHKTIILPPGKYLVRRQREYEEDRDRWVTD